MFTRYASMNYTTQKRYKNYYCCVTSVETGILKRNNLFTSSNNLKAAFPEGEKL